MKRKNILLLLQALIFYFSFSFDVLAINNWEQAQAACIAPLNPEDPTNYCVTHYETTICSVVLSGDATGYVRREYSGIPPCTTTNTFVFGDDLCRSDMSRHPTTGQCVCPSGQYDNGASCVTQPLDCNSGEIATMCSSGTPICTGTYQAPISCFISTGEGDCETSTVQTFSGCPAVCQGDSVEDPVTHSCIDPQCEPPTVLVNHSCQSCPAPQTYNAQSGSCQNPDCATGYTFDSNQMQCVFSGCPAGYSQGNVNGDTYCAKDATGTITNNPNHPVSVVTTQDGNGGGSTVTTNADGSVTTKTTVVNPDGSVSTTTTTTPGPTGGTGQSQSEIKLDTSGLSQQQTSQDILDTLKGALGADGGPDTDAGTVAGQICSGGQCGANKSEIDIGAMGGFSHSGIITSSGSCPVPLEVDNPMFHFEIKFDPFCELAPLIRALLLIAASFVAIRIITSGA
jgi:hypothetical protein